MLERPIVGVFGGGAAPEEVRSQARQLGAAIAERGWIVLNGGRSAGVMQASAEGASQTGGLVVGVLPSSGRTDPRADVAQAVDVPVFTGMGEARNNVNVLTSDAAVALPGGAGTVSEAALAVKNRTPLVVVGGEWPASVREHADRADSVAETIELVEERLRENTASG
jgi:uncharacterized protein (TIGR00725 family)